MLGDAGTAVDFQQLIEIICKFIELNGITGINADIQCSKANAKPIAAGISLDNILNALNEFLQKQSASTARGTTFLGMNQNPHDPNKNCNPEIV